MQEDGRILKPILVEKINASDIWFYFVNKGYCEYSSYISIFFPQLRVLDLGSVERILTHRFYEWVAKKILSGRAEEVNREKEAIYEVVRASLKRLVKCAEKNSNAKFEFEGFKERTFQHLESILSNIEGQDYFLPHLMERCVPYTLAGFKGVVEEINFFGRPDFILKMGNQVFALDVKPKYSEANFYQTIVGALVLKENSEWLRKVGFKTKGELEFPSRVWFFYYDSGEIKQKEFYEKDVRKVIGAAKEILSWNFNPPLKVETRKCKKCFTRAACELYSPEVGSTSSSGRK